MHTEGPTAAHCASLVQDTQVLLAPSQMGLPTSEQSSLVAHSTHRPESASQAGAVMGQPPSTAAQDTHA
jgi:hypothetical protein